MICSVCGEAMIGDGYKTVIHCPNAEYDEYAYLTPDDFPVECSACADDLVNCQL